MLGLLAIACISFIICSFVAVEEPTDKALVGFVSFVVSFCAGLIVIALIGSVISLKKPYELVSIVNTPIVSSSDGSTISGVGSFLYVTINEEQRYFFYKEKDGYIVQDSILASEAKIKETSSDIKPHIETKTFKQKSSDWLPYIPQKYKEYIIYVPKGSVIKEHIYDLED